MAERQRRPGPLAALRCCLVAALSGVTSGRLLLQQEMVCVLFVPFRPADYNYVSTLSDVRRRESFASARSRAVAITQTAQPDTLWNFETLDGSPYDAADALALTAFPDMDNRSEDLYVSYLITALLDATGVDLNDIIGKSSKMPYYYAHKLCSGAECSSYTPGELASIQAQTEGARGTISCATDPNDLALPFTEDGERPPPQKVDSVGGLLSAEGGGPVVFESPGAAEDVAAAETDSQAPVDTLFTPAPAPPLALEPLLAPTAADAPTSGTLLGVPLAAAPGLAPGLAPAAGAPRAQAVGAGDDAAAAGGPGASGPAAGAAERSLPGGGPCQGSDAEACADYEEPGAEDNEDDAPPEMLEGRATSGEIADVGDRDYSLNVVLIIVGIAAVLAVGVCALIAFGVIKRRRKGMDSSAKPLFAIGPASTGSFTHTPDSATSPSTALVNPRPSDSAPGPILGLTAPLDLGPPSARSAGAAGRGLGSAGSSDLDAWAFGSVNGGNSKGPYVGGGPALLRSTSLSGSVSLAHLTYPAAPGHGSSASQAGASQLDTLSSQGESAGLASAAAGGSGAAAALLQTATSGASSPERKLSDGATPGNGSASGSGGSNAAPVPAATGFGAASPRRVYQPPAGAAVMPPKDPPHVLGTVFEGSDSHEIRDSMSHSVALEASAPAAASAFATTELLVAASPAADRDGDASTQHLAVTGAISEEELEQAGRPRPLGAILSEMTGELGEEDAEAEGAGGGSGGWARGEAVEPPSSDEAPGPLPALPQNAASDPSRSRTVSASTGASIQLPGFPTPTPARETFRWTDSGAGRPSSPTANP